MARLFDNNYVVEINMIEWHCDDTGHDKDWSMEVLKVNELPYNAVLNAYEVCDTNEYTNLAMCWESCKGAFCDDKDPEEENRYAGCHLDKKSTRFLVYMREKAIDSLMQTYVYNEKANHCPQEKVEQFNKMLRSFLEERSLDELEGSRIEWLNDTVAQMWSDFCDKEESEMGYTQDGDCWLYEAQSNGLNFLILEEEYRGKHIVFNWDISEEEVATITEKFLGAGLTEDDFQNDAKWEEGDFREKHGFISYDVLA